MATGKKMATAEAGAEEGAAHQKFYKGRSIFTLAEVIWEKSR